MVPSVLASSVCWSLQCLILALTEGGGCEYFLRLTCSVVLWGGRNTANKYHWRVWGVLTVFQLHWVCSCSWRVCFHGLHCSGSRLLCRELFDVGPGLHAPPRSQVQVLGYSTEVQTQLGLRFVPFPGLSSSGDEVFGEHGHCDLSPPPSLLLGFLGVHLLEHLCRRMSRTPRSFS